MGVLLSLVCAGPDIWTPILYPQEAKSTHVIEQSVELKQQPPAEERQPSTGFWNNSHGTLTSRVLSLFPDMKKATKVPGGTGELASVAPLVPECETGGQEA